MHRLVCCLWLIAILTTAVAQNFAPNPSFEWGETTPEGWRLNGGVGRWEIFGRTGKRCVSVTGTGTDSNAWECTAWQPKAGGLFLVRFFIRRSHDSRGGTPITGFSTVNRDVWDVPLDGQWHLRQFVCRTPVHRTDTVLRFGQWHVKGKVSYDDVEVLPVIAVHRRIGKTDLGLGESIRNGVYHFVTNFGRFGSENFLWLAGNDSRPLFAHTAVFNDNRWVFSERWQESGEWVLYRHSVGYPLAAAVLHLTVGYYKNGQVVLEVSKDGKAWREVGRFAPSGEYTTQVPDDLLPTDELWVRFWATGVLQVDNYRLDAKLNGNPPDAKGETWYFALTKISDVVEVTPKALIDDALLVQGRNRTAKALKLALELRAGAKLSQTMMALPPNGERSVRVPLPPLQEGRQAVTLTVREGEKIVAEMQAEVQKAWIEFGGFGEHLAETDSFSLWWCEATYKVGRTTAMPVGFGASGHRSILGKRANKSIRLEAARNEYEPFQLVLTPKVPLNQLRLRLTPFKPTSRKSPVANRPVWDEVALVEYVPVTIPTDALGAVGEYPDPLVPLWRREREKLGRGEPKKRSEREKVEGSVEVTVQDLKANRNQPLWLTVYVPKGTTAGTYRSAITLLEAIDANGKPIAIRSSPIAVELHVFDFALPDETPLRTAYGVGIDNYWHRLKTPEQFRQVWDLYMQTCRRYHISPFAPHDYAPIRWKMVAEKPEPEFRYDFTDFDEAMSRYLDEFRFNGFNLIILPKRLGRHERFSPEWNELYKRLMTPILEHLRKKGWLKKAYCYWADEPPPDRYEYVKQGMAALKEATPGIRRLLTICHEKAPVPALYGLVDLWVPVLHMFDPQRAKERQKLGEEVWWYVCTDPKQPYPNNFIDHPAITHRIRYWMAAKWDIDGELYWNMTWYRGKGYRLRNPYEDGQSETPKGGYWGNGDGRLLYPPVRQPSSENAEPVIASPVPSVRLALIAEGLEDHAYFWLLKRLREKARKAKSKSPALQKALKRADEALGVLDLLIRSQTDYEKDPKKLYAARRKVAEAIERLRRLSVRP